jgi:hypothetical protein
MNWSDRANCSRAATGKMERRFCSSPARRNALQLVIAFGIGLERHLVRQQKRAFGWTRRNSYKALLAISL